MGRVGLVCALSALLFVLVVSETDSNSTNGSSAPPSITPPFPDNDEDVRSENQAKNQLGEGRGREGYQNRNYRKENRYRSRSRSRSYDDDESNEYGYDIHPFSRVKPYFDTHYCSVHGSFRLAYNEKVETKENAGGNNYQQSGGSYGSQPSSGGYGSQPSSGGYGSQPSSGGYGSQPSSGGYGSPSNYGSQSYGAGDNTRYVRKITRQYCRYAAAWSEKACKFCCKIVARSAYTNPDDIIAAIFSFDPADPSGGGAGIESYGDKDDYEKSGEYGNNYSEGNSYSDGNGNSYSGGSSQGGYENNNYGGSNQGGYGNANSYSGGPNQSGYGNANSYAGNSNQGGYGNGNSYAGNSNQGGYSNGFMPAQYGNGPYRHKRSNGYSPAPSYSAPASDSSYGQSSADQPASQYSATHGAYEQKPDYGNKYENNPKAINQCVCCAPKHRYY